MPSSSRLSLISCRMTLLSTTTETGPDAPDTKRELVRTDHRVRLFPTYTPHGLPATHGADRRHRPGLGGTSADSPKGVHDHPTGTGSVLPVAAITAPDTPP